ncbi:MAG: GntR family transcriptional regulator [Paenibacillaceae bacterium]|nr:GntR family transcriptional regulator [Paenibacillaceae bacterium]
MTSSTFDSRTAIPIAGKPSLEKSAYYQLREQIVRGDYLPGTLLSENELAERLNMSRTPIRAAISLLETEGFLESIRGRGVFVKDITFREFGDMLEVLAAMQMMSIETAAKRGLRFDMAALRLHLDRQIRAADEEDYLTYYESSLQFVGTILEAAQNRTMMEILDKIKGKYTFKIVSFRKMHHGHLSRPNNARRYNERVYAALERGDCKDARQAVFELNELAREQMPRFDV